MDPNSINQALTQLEPILGQNKYHTYSIEELIDIVMDSSSSWAVSLTLVLGKKNHDHNERCRLVYAAKLINECLATYPDSLFLLVTNILRTSTSNDMKLKTSMYLQYVFRNKGFSYWFSLPESTRLSLQAQLFLSIHTEEDASVKKQLTATVAEIGKKLLPFHWNEFFPFVVECVNADSHVTKVSGLNLISQLSGSLLHHSPHLHLLFLNTLSPTSSPNLEVRMASLDATVSFCFALSSVQLNHDLFQTLPDLVPVLVATLTEATNSDQKKDWLKLLFDKLICVSPNFLGNSKTVIENLRKDYIFSISEDQESVNILNSDNLGAFRTLISNLTSRNFQVMTRAEIHANNLKRNCPSSFSRKICRFLNNTEDPELTHMALIYLGNELPTLWQSLHSMDRLMLKERLLNFLETSMVRKVCERLCIVIGILVIELKVWWPELITQIHRWFESFSPWLQEWSLVLLAQLSPYVISTHDPSLDAMHTMFLRSLSRNSVDHVRIAALCGCIALVKVLTDVSEKVIFQNLLPLMMDTLMDLSHSGRDELVHRGLVAFDELIEADPIFLSVHIDRIVWAMLHVARKQLLQVNQPLQVIGNRALVVEALVSLAELGLLKETPEDLTTELLAILVQMSFEEEFGPFGNNGQINEAILEELEVVEEIADIGEVDHDLILRLASSSSMDSGRIIQPAKGVLCRSFGSSDWQICYSGIMVVVKIANGLSVDQLEFIISMLLVSAGHDHPSVRFATLNAIRLLCGNFRPDFKTRFGDMVRPVLQAAVNDFSNDLVQQMAARTLFELER